MLSATKTALWLAIEQYMKDKGLLISHLKIDNPLPCSWRWVCALKKSIAENDSMNFNKKLCIELMQFLKIDYTEDGGVLVILNNKNAANENV